MVEGALGGLGVEEQPVAKIPSINTQAPDQLQIPRSNLLAPIFLEVWCLVFVWSVDAGAWDFRKFVMRFEVFVAVRILKNSLHT